MRYLAHALLVTASVGPAAAGQSPLQALVDWKDGVTRASAITQDATDAPEDERFWMGHGVRRAQIEVGTRQRQFTEENGADQASYLSELIDVEYDELGSLVDHRLFVCTAYQPRTGVPPRLQYLNVFNPAAPFEIAVVDLVDTSANPKPYQIESIRVIPEQKLVLAVGNVVGATAIDDEPLLVLFRYGQPSPTEPDQLVKIAESRPGQFVLPCNPSGGTHEVIRATHAFVHEIDGELVAFVTVAFAPHGKPLPRGVGLCKIDADAAAPEDRLVWLTTPQHFIDPAELDFGCLTPQAPGYAYTVAVNYIDFVDVAGPNETVQHFAYLACGSKWQVREYDVTNVLGSSGFGTPRQIDLPVNPQGTVFEDLHWLAARNVPAENVDLLYVAGTGHMHCAHRTVVGAHKATPHWLQSGFGVEGHVVVEQTLLTNGDREHVWTVADEVSHPWTVFDMTDRFHNPAVEPPEILETHYAPGGCDGAVAIPELESVYAPYFAGVVRYDVGQTFANGAVFAEPVYDSYRAAQTAGVGAHVVEQIDTIRFSATDHRLYTPNGRGDVLEWKIDATTKRPDPPTLIDLDWGVSWASSYSERATPGWSEHADRPFLLLEYFSTDTSAPPAIRVGRYWPAFNGQIEAWQVLDLTASADPEGLLRAYVNDVAVAGDWGLVAMGNGIVVLGLGTATDPMGFTVADTLYTVPSDLDLDRLHGGIAYPEVEGIAGIPGTIAISVGRNKDEGAAIALLAQDEVTGEITALDYVVWDSRALDAHPDPIPAVDGIPGTDFYKPGVLRFYQHPLSGDYRLYAGCNFSGAVLEFPVEVDPYGTWLGNPEVWHDGTHPNAVSDVRPYDVGHASRLPLILVSRYRQTIAILAASGMLPEGP